MTSGSVSSASLLVFALFAMASGPVTAGPISADVEPMTISVAPIRYAIDARQKVGEKRAGLLCLPNGSLSFQQLVLPQGDALIAEIAGKLSSSGLNVLSVDPSGLEESTALYRAVATVTGMELSVCAKRWGLGDRSSVQGMATVVVEWAIYERATRRHVGSLNLSGNYATHGRSLSIGELISNATLNAVTQIPSTQNGRALHHLD